MSKHLSACQDHRAALIDDFRAYLVSRGHTPATLQHYCSAVSHFLWWRGEADDARSPIDPQSVACFLSEHLPVCRCERSFCKELKSARAALNQLLLMHGGDRLRASIALASTEIEGIVSRFDTHLDHASGLAAATRWYHRRNARSFLLGLYGDGPVDFSRITVDTLFEFVNDQARSLTPASIGILTYSLRTLLRFLAFEGHLQPDLTRAVPRPAVWSLASLPPSLSVTEQERFWSAFEQGTAVGRRDYAMAHCLADLGLRCQEVANLQLDDIDWRGATVHLIGNKSRRAAQLPLPQITGSALADYLQAGRPASRSRSVFVVHRAPVGQPMTVAGVRGAIRRAFTRAGLSWTGTHILRHTAAARMVQEGVSIKEVADVLGHRSIDTTFSYTKVDLPQLARVALPWPGRCL